MTLTEALEDAVKQPRPDENRATQAARANLHGNLLRRLSAQELSAASKAQDWHTLWEQALPIVKFSMSSLVRGGLDRRCCSDDALQAAFLAAGSAVRSWKPEKGEFSTWIVLRAQGAIINHANKERNGMVGGRDTFGATYEINEEFTPDEKEAGALAGLELDEMTKAVRDILFRAAEDPLDHEIICYRFGIGSYPLQTMAEIARRLRLPLRTVERRLQKALKEMAGFAEKSGYFNEAKENAA